jgi:hypothetical protein
MLSHPCRREFLLGVTAAAVSFALVSDRADACADPVDDVLGPKMGELYRLVMAQDDLVIDPTFSDCDEFWLLPGRGRANRRVTASILNHTRGFTVAVLEARERKVDRRVRLVPSARDAVAFAQRAIGLVEPPTVLRRFRREVVGLDWAFISLARRIKAIGVAGDWYSPFGDMGTAFADQMGYVAHKRENGQYEVGLLAPTDDFCSEVRTALGKGRPMTRSGPCIDWRFQTHDQVISALGTIRDVGRGGCAKAGDELVV